MSLISLAAVVKSLKLPDEVLLRISREIRRVASSSLLSIIILGRSIGKEDSDLSLFEIMIRSGKIPLFSI